ncbi:hypothetical protein [Ekhidna sp.]|uniref:hypothetical protein n=1 Tax=Ekhidna sp. TaxID=2608089 RepID=UPI00329A5F4F
MKSLFSLLFILVLLAGCSNEVEPDETGDLLIRIQNGSAVIYSDIVVNADGVEKHFGSLNAFQYSSYKSFEYAYRYAFVELKINGQTFTIQPFDYVGEEVIEEGKFTYIINTTNNNDRYSKLTIEMKED